MANVATATMRFHVVATATCHPNMLSFWGAGHSGLMRSPPSRGPPFIVSCCRRNLSRATIFYYDRDGAGRIPRHDLGRRSQDHVRGKRDDLGHLSAHPLRAAPSPANVDLRVAADGPTRLLQSLKEGGEPRLFLRIFGREIQGANSFRPRRPQPGIRRLELAAAKLLHGGNQRAGGVAYFLLKCCVVVEIIVASRVWPHISNIGAEL